MSAQPQHQNNSRALVSPGSADRRRSSAPAYYLGRPASLWIDITSPRGRRNAPGQPADAITGSRERTLVVARRPGMLSAPYHLSIGAARADAYAGTCRAALITGETRTPGGTDPDVPAVVE